MKKICMFCNEEIEGNELIPISLILTSIVANGEDELILYGDSHARCKDYFSGEIRGAAANFARYPEADKPKGKLS